MWPSSTTAGKPPTAVVTIGKPAAIASGTTITSETVWNDGAQGGASGGGVSSFFALPAWQEGAILSSLDAIARLHERVVKS